MVNIIKNEFISTKKSVLIIFNALIVATIAFAYFASTKLVGTNIFTESDIVDLFFKSTVNMLAPFIIILASKVITEEFNNGGMKIYLINPISRNEVLIGKSIFIFINVLISMVIQLLLSLIVVCVLLQIPSLSFVIDITLRYLVTLLPVIGLILIFTIPGLLMNTSRNAISGGFLLIAAFNVVASFYEKLNPYSIMYIMKTISVSNQDLVNNILISFGYIVIGFIISSYIFSSKEIS